MEQAKSLSMMRVILLVLMIKSIGGQTCYNMWDPIFEIDSDNPPTMCTGK